MTEETFDAASVGITHHCLVRWLERACALDLNAARELALAKANATANPEKRLIRMIEEEYGLDLDPLRHRIRSEIASGQIAVVTHAKDGSVRSWSSTTDTGRIYIIMKSNDGGYYVPTLLGSDMTPM